MPYLSSVVSGGAPRTGCTSHTLGNVMTLSGCGRDSQMLSKFYARYSGRPVCSGTCPVGREEGILIVEWSLTGTETHCFGPYQERRWDEPILCRLRIGHVAYLTHRHLLCGDPPPVCVGCQERLSVEHILIHCVEYIDIRHLYFNVNTVR